MTDIFYKCGCGGVETYVPDPDDPDVCLNCGCEIIVAGRLD